MIGDPARVNLRKAARAAILTPALFALADLVFDHASVALFTAFASFAALVFADFGGPLLGRSRAYAGLLGAGAVLVALGTLLSDTTVGATIAMFAIGFVIVFVGALGGYFAAAGTSAVLAFVLAAMVPAPVDQLAGREAGWFLGVGVAAVASLVLWPVQERRQVRAACADMADALAVALDPATPAPVDVVARTGAELRARTGAVFRPAGSAARERALVSLVRELHLAAPFVGALPAVVSPSDHDLRVASAVTLRAATGALRSLADTIDVAPLVRARAAHTKRLEAWAGLPDSALDPPRVVQGFDDEFPLRALSLRVLAIASDVATATGAHLVGLDAAHDHAPADLGFLTPPAPGSTILRTLADHWSVHSVRFRAAVRAGLGLAIAVLVAKAFDLDHAFWVVLGTLSVLRSNALGTGVTALQAVLGTTIGFAVASALVVVVGGDDTALWFILPVAVFLSAYTPGAIHFVVGQACFTIFVVVLFNLLEPEGWRTGLVRVEDIAIGVGISIVVGVLLWPRGARQVVVDTFSEMLRTGGRYTTRALATVVGDPADTLDGSAETTTARATAEAAHARAVSALEDLSVERGGGRVDLGGWVSLLSLSSTLFLAGDGLARLAVRDTTGGCHLARRELADAGAEVERAVGAVADRVVDPSLAPPVVVVAPATDGLCACVHERVGLGEGPPVTLLWAREFLALVEQRLTTSIPSDAVPTAPRDRSAPARGTGRW